MVSAFWFLADKRKYGRTGWPGVAADSYRFDQKNASTAGGLPPGLWKLQVDHTASPNLFLTARLAHQDMGFGLFARGPDDHWMGRLAFSWNDWVEQFEGTPVGAFSGNPGPTRTNPLVEGGQVAVAGKNDIFSSVKWQIYANAMVELRWTFELSGAVFGRQRHPYPKFLRLRAGQDGNRPALAQPRVDEDRYQNLWDLDLRLARPVRLRGATLTLGAELFNVFNSGVTLKRDGNARASSFDRIDEVLSPRILRLGARLSF